MPNKFPFTLDFKKLSINRYIPIYLIACYCYYCESENIISDADHDKLCQMIDKYWDYIEHPHKKLVDRDSLDTSTGNELKSFYPKIVQNSSKQLIGGIGILECVDTENTYIHIEGQSLEQFFVD